MKVLSQEWKSEGVMDDESGELMELVEVPPVILLTCGRNVLLIIQRVRPRNAVRFSASTEMTRRCKLHYHYASAHALRTCSLLLKTPHFLLSMCMHVSGTPVNAA